MGDAEFATGVACRQAFAQLNLDGGQMTDDLLSGVPFPCHRSPLDLAIEPNSTAGLV